MLLFNRKPLDFVQFPNGEVGVKKFFAQHNPDPAIWDHDRVALKYENDTDLFRLLLVREAIGFPCSLDILYMPYSRMDRASKEFTFTLKTVAKFINSMDWLSVTVYEPHSDVTTALLDRCKEVSLVQRLLGRLTFSHFQVFYPDAGAQKRYANLSSGSPSLDNWRAENQLVGFKHRDFGTGKITSYDILGRKAQDTVVIVDDLCSKGGTFVMAADKLRKMGFKKVILVVGHCEKTIFDGYIFEMVGLIDEVYTTNTILDDNQGHENLHILSVV